MDYITLILVIFSTEITIAASFHCQRLQSSYRITFYSAFSLYFISITKILKLDNVKLDWILSVQLILLSIKYLTLAVDQPIEKHKSKFYIDLFSFEDLNSSGKDTQGKGLLSIVIGIFQLQTLKYLSKSIIPSAELIKMEYGLERTFQFYLCAVYIYLFASGWTLIFYGILQSYFLIPMKQVFDNPYCSKNPIDLWKNTLDLCFDILNKNSKQLDVKSKKVYMYKEMFYMFICWGIFCEIFNLLTFGIMTGEAFMFFILNGIITCGYVFIDRNQFLAEEKPSNLTNLKAIALHSFCQAYILPLFTLPYIRSGFFD